MATRKRMWNRIPGWMAPNELSWLQVQAGKMQSVVEVGSWKGRSTYALLTGCRGVVYAVDHFRGSPSELGTTHREAVDGDIFGAFWANVGHFPHLVVVREESGVAAGVVPDVDMVFLDGEHTEAAVVRDLGLWRPKAKRLLCGHDVNWTGVERALVGCGVPFERGPGSLWYSFRG